MSIGAVMQLRSRRFRRRRWWQSFVAVALLLLAHDKPARASLGDDVSAVATDQARFGARLKLVQRARYAVHELTVPTGATVREFGSDAGKIFAVSWSGGFRPNLRDLMGAHYDRFVEATRGRRVPRGIVQVEVPGMVVVMGGYLRTFFGYVVLTDLLPSGVSAEEIR